jgi:hypothetical protein
MLPTKGWGTYEAALRAVGERRHGVPDGSDFLGELGFVEKGRLTELGQAYFDAEFVHQDRDRSTAVLTEALRNYAPAAVVCQVLFGAARVNKHVVETVLRSEGYGDAISDRTLGSLLMLMTRAEMISYTKTTGEVRITFQPAERPLSRAVFVSPRTPFSNKVWLRRVLEECSGYILWLDKHFLPVAFDAIAEAADANRIQSIRVLSLRLPANDSRRVRRQYFDLVDELAQRGVTFHWHVVDAGAIRDTHDRWILGRITARNVPNVNAIYSGQYAELLSTDNRAECERLYEEYWTRSESMFIRT